MSARELHDHTDERLAVGAEPAEHARLEDAIEPAIQQSAMNRIGIEAARIDIVLLLAQLGADLGSLGEQPRSGWSRIGEGRSGGLCAHSETSIALSTWRGPAICRPCHSRCYPHARC